MECFDNHWVGHSVMKPVDAGSFQRRKDINEVGEGRNEDFDIYILQECYIYKA